MELRSIRTVTIGKCNHGPASGRLWPCNSTGGCLPGRFYLGMVIALAALQGQGVKWIDGEVRYDHTHALWKLYKQGEVKVLEAEWNIASKEGRVKDPNKFGDSICQCGRRVS